MRLWNNFILTLSGDRESFSGSKPVCQFVRPDQVVSLSLGAYGSYSKDRIGKQDGKFGILS